MLDTVKLLQVLPNEGRMDLDRFTYTPKWTHLLMFRASVFKNVVVGVDIKPEHLIVTLRKSNTTLLWLANKSRTQRQHSTYQPDIDHRLMQSADSIVRFKGWPTGNVTYIKDRMGGIPNPETKEENRIVTDLFNARFKKHYDEWMRDLY